MGDKIEFVIHIDGKMVKVDRATLSGAELKALAGRDASYQLFMEEQGDKPDLQISDTYSVQLRNGQHFYTVPAATFGR